MYVDRPTAEHNLRTALRRSPAVVLLGPRQVGKSTLARRLAADSPGAIYLDLERQADLRKLDDPDAYLRRQSGKLIVIDEIHRAPGLFPELRGVIDERRAAGERRGQYLLLGSASLDLMRQSAESLAGRVSYIDLDPLGIEETNGAAIEQDVLWLRGGFPESLLADDDDESFAWRESFIRSYLERDVPMFAPRMPAETIGRLWQMLATAQGTILNQARLAQGLGVSAPMVTRYVDLLVDLKLVRRLQPWSGNVGKRLVKSPKVYVRDTGLLHGLLEIATYEQLVGHSIVGPSWEAFVLENLITATAGKGLPFYYRTADGAEIDLVFEKAGKPSVAIEVKRSTAPTIEPGFFIACDDLDIKRRLVVYGGSESYEGKGHVHMEPLAGAVEQLRNWIT